MYDRHGHDLHSCVSSSSNALRSRSTSTGLLPLVSRPRLLSSARNSTTFNLDGSIMHARYAPLIRQANSCTPQRLTQRRKCSQKTHIHAPLTRAAYTIWRNSRKQLVTQRAPWLLVDHATVSTDASCTTNRDRCFIRDQVRRVRRLVHSKAGRAIIGHDARCSCEFKKGVRLSHTLIHILALLHFIIFVSLMEISEND